MHFFGNSWICTLVLNKHPGVGKIFGNCCQYRELFFSPKTQRNRRGMQGKTSLWLSFLSLLLLSRGGSGGSCAAISTCVLLHSLLQLSNFTFSSTASTRSRHFGRLQMPFSNVFNMDNFGDASSNLTASSNFNIAASCRANTPLLQNV